MPSKITFEEALKRFEHRDDIFLCEEGWKGWKVKSKFFDKVANDYFWMLPEKCLARNSSHPSRRLEKTKKTNLEKYGVENPFQSEVVKKKIKKTNLSKYGVQNPAQNKDIYSKIQKTNLKKWGHVCPLHNEINKEKILENNKNKWGKDYYSQTEEYKDRYKKTCLEKYGVDNPLKHEPIKEKVEKTNIERYGYKSPLSSLLIRDKGIRANIEKYGVQNPSHLKEFQDKKKEVFLEKYGSPTYVLTEDFKEKSFKTNQEKYDFGNYAKHHTSNRRIKETGDFITDWLRKYKGPKPSYTAFKQHFPNKEIRLSDLLKYIEKAKLGKTGLEVLAEKLLGIPHFNCKAQEGLKYRPDFKVNKTTFVNVDGLWWHCDANKGKYDHFNMRKDFEDNGLRILQFYDSEIRSSGHIIASIIDNASGKIINKIFARKCAVKKVSQKDAQVFLVNNHLMGSSTSAKHIGLYHEDRLVYLLSYKVKANILKLERYCSEIDSIVVGGFSKVLDVILENVGRIKEIHVRVDLRYGTGNHLAQNGFIIKEEKLDWKWTNCREVFEKNKSPNTANRLSNKIEEVAMRKIYDAGQRLWVKAL